MLMRSRSLSLEIVARDAVDVLQLSTGEFNGDAVVRGDSGLSVMAMAALASVAECVGGQDAG